MELSERIMKNGRTELTVNIIPGPYSVSEIVNLFSRLRDRNVFCCNRKFKRKYIEMMDFSNVQNYNVLVDIVNELNNGVTKIYTDENWHRDIKATPSDYHLMKHIFVDGKCKVITSNYAWKRSVIYNICEIYGYSYKKIVKHHQIRMGCDFYAPGLINPGICGCDFAPKKFRKAIREIYKTGNRPDYYDVDVHYSTIPWTQKLGVEIIKV